MTKCVICEQRPHCLDGYCANCASKLKAEHKAKVDGKPKYFLTYRGHVVGLFSKDKGKLSPRLLTRSVENLPKRNSLDLNRFCVGYSRKTIKDLKACVLRLANA